MTGGNEGESDIVVLRLDGITKRFGPLVANDRIGFSVRRGEIVALLGENGAGKTTLMNILFGHYVADEGAVEVAGTALPPGDPAAALAAGVGMVHQHFTLADNLTVLENITLGTQPLSRFSSAEKAARARLNDLRDRFGLAVDLDSTVAALSVGERQRVEILKALYGETRILILDEPTAVLTPGEVETLFATLHTLVAAGLAVIFISHKLGEVLAVSDRVIVLRGGKVAGERETRATDRSELAALMVGEEVAAPEIPVSKPGATLFELDRVSTRPGDHPRALHDLSLSLKAGTITGLAGVSGNGQAALAALIAGEATPISGAIRINGAAVGPWSPRQALAHGIGRIPEDRHAVGTIADMSITENVISESYRTPALAAAGFLNWREARDRTEAVIDAYDVKCPSPDAAIRLLSGGNMQKLILGRVLEAEPTVILANQPTRGLDIGAVAYVHRRLLDARARGAAILLISEDLDELLALSDTVHVMFRGRLSPPMPRGTASLREVGELMAGHGFEALDKTADGWHAA